MNHISHDDPHNPDFPRDVVAAAEKGGKAGTYSICFGGELRITRHAGDDTTHAIIIPWRGRIEVDSPVKPPPLLFAEVARVFTDSIPGPAAGQYEGGGE